MTVVSDKQKRLVIFNASRKVKKDKTVNEESNPRIQKEKVTQTLRNILIYIQMRIPKILYMERF